MEKKTGAAGKVFEVLWWTLQTAIAVYAVLFAIFYFDLDSKIIYRRILPKLNAHYDNMHHKDITKNPYAQNVGPAARNPWPDPLGRHEP